jgi:hypothetical protein
MPRQPRARLLTTAIGLLSAFPMPHIECVDSFKGQSCHTARWPQEPVSFEDNQTRCISRYSGSAPPYRARLDEVAKADYGEVSLS